MSIWNSVLKYFGLIPCCDKPELEVIVDTIQYYEYRCKNCDRTYSGGGYSRF